VDLDFSSICFEIVRYTSSTFVLVVSSTCRHSVGLMHIFGHVDIIIFKFSVVCALNDWRALVILFDP
jgi:hypothetical protein